MRDVTMAEQPVATAIAEVMIYNGETKSWDRPGGPDASSMADVQVLQDVTKVATFRIIAVRKQDGKWLVNQTIHQKLKYQAPNNVFHQWRNEHRQVYGLNFTYEHDAAKFLSAVQNSMEIVSSSSEYQYGTIGGDASNGVYQDPHSYYQQSNMREADQDSIGSNGAGHINGAYRKSSNNFAAHPHAQSQPAHGHVPHAASIATPHHQQYAQQPQSVQQRRASQGSSGSTSTNSSGPGNIYATAAHVNGYQNGTNGQSVNRSAPAPPPAPPPPPTAASTSNGGSSLPPISTSAPPPPPPPMLKAAGGPKGQTLADALASKAGQLRKASDANGVQRPANAPSAADNGGGSKTSTVSSTTSMGQPDFLSELTARFKNKKPATETAPETVNGASSGEAEKRTNGELNQRPWQKTSSSSINSATTPNGTATDSPKVHRKVPSGSSLSSQEDASSRAPQTVAATSANVALTSLDLERFKQEIMVEVQREISKAKTDIIEALRQELQRR